MAWLYQRKYARNKPAHWWVGFRQNGKQVLQSTGLCDRVAAQKELDKIEAMLAAQRAGVLSFKLYQEISGRTVKAVTVKGALEDWIDETARSASKHTLAIYQALADALTHHFHVTDQGPMVSDLTREQLQGFLNERREKVAASTANLTRKCLAVFIRRCNLRDNPLEGIESFKASKEEKSIRRAFTAAELGLLYQHAPDDFWRYMVVAGFFTGLRLGDLVTMPIGAVNFKTRTITLRTRKTGAAMLIPIAAPLYAMLTELRAQRKDAKPTDPFWPEQAKRYEEQASGGFSGQFADLLAKAGISGPRTRGSMKKIKTDRRTVKEVSFHCLRHSYVTTLAKLGQSQQIVKALAGHSSDEINDLYTHLPIEALMPAIALLPDITNLAQPEPRPN
jgi:integrase